MSSSVQTGSSSMDATLNEFFDKVAKHARLLIAGLVLIIIASVAIALAINHRESVSNEARNALYLAQKSMDTEAQAIADAQAAAAPAKDAAKPGAKTDAKAKTPPPPNAANIEYKPLDVDAKFPESLKLLRAVADRYPGTRSAYEANLAAGDLYFNHGDPAKALDWYQRSVGDAPDRLAKAFAYSAIAYAYENIGKASDSAQYFQKAIDMGEPSIKGDALLGLARAYEGMKDTAKARSTYDQIVTDMPGTDFAKTAELYRGQLK